MKQLKAKIIDFLFSVFFAKYKRRMNNLVADVAVLRISNIALQRTVKELADGISQVDKALSE